MISCCLLASYLVPSVVAARESRPADVPPEHVLGQLADTQKRLRAWYIEYQSERDSSGIYIHRIVAAREPDQFYAWSFHGSDQTHWTDDALQQRLVVTSSGAFNEFTHSRRFWTMPLPTTAPLPGSAPEEFMFVVLGWWPFQGRPSPELANGAPTTIPGALQSNSYKVLSSQERVRDRWCHVMEFPGRDTWWLDAERNSVPIAREMRDPESGNLMQRVEMMDHRQVQPGIWVPMAFQNTLYEMGRKAGATQPYVKMRASLKVLEVRLNDDVSPSLFSFRPRPGSIQIFEDGTWKQQTAGGTEYLNDLAAWIAKTVAPREPAFRGTSARVVVEWAVLVAVLIAIMYRPRRRQVS